MSAMDKDVKVTIREKPVNRFVTSVTEEWHYNRVLSDDERRRIEAYLSDKYGVPNPVAYEA